MHSHDPQQATQVDPVCGMQVSPDSAAAKLCYNGQRLFFCAQGCKEAFEAHPEHYLKKGPKRKGFWQRYLDRLTKATGGQPMSCH